MAGMRKNHREAQIKYRQTEKGKKAHREAENRRRHGLNQKNMDDATSTPRLPWAMELLTHKMNRCLRIRVGTRCHFCGVEGQIVGVFPRRGYG